MNPSNTEWMNEWMKQQGQHQGQGQQTPRLWDKFAWRAYRSPSGHCGMPPLLLLRMCTPITNDTTNNELNKKRARGFFFFFKYLHTHTISSLAVAALITIWWVGNKRHGTVLLQRCPDDKWWQLLKNWIAAADMERWNHLNLSSLSSASSRL